MWAVPASARAAPLQCRAGEHCRLVELPEPRPTLGRTQTVFPSCASSAVALETVYTNARANARVPFRLTNPPVDPVSRRSSNSRAPTVDGPKRNQVSRQQMDRSTDEIARRWVYTFRRLGVGRASGSRQASSFYLWYLTIAGVPAPRRKPAPGCVIHKTRPTGPDAGQHGRLPGEILQPKGLSQGEQWRRRPNTSVRALLFLQSLMEGPTHDGALTSAVSGSA